MMNFLYVRLGMLPIWPTPEHVRESFPGALYELHPTALIGNDAAEIICKVASSLLSQSQLYSSYKPHTTLKGLIGMHQMGQFALCVRYGDTVGSTTHSSA